MQVLQGDETLAEGGQRGGDALPLDDHRVKFVNLAASTPRQTVTHLVRVVRRGRLALVQLVDVLEDGAQFVVDAVDRARVEEAESLAHDGELVDDRRRALADHLLELVQACFDVRHVLRARRLTREHLVNYARRRSLGALLLGRGDRRVELTADG